MRARMAATENFDADPKRKEKLDRLRKQMKGWMNRLSEANMHKIASDIEMLFMQNTSFDVKQTLTNLMLDSLISPSLAPERMVMEHAMLVAVLHANVGSEVGKFACLLFVGFYNLIFRMVF